MKTESLCLNVLHVPLFWLSYYYERVFVIYTQSQKHPSTYLKISFSKSAQNQTKMVLNMNEEWELNLTVQTDLKILLFGFSNYYKSVILVILTPKRTLSLINMFSSPKLLIPRKKWLCKVKREMKTESFCINLLRIPRFLFELLLRESICSYTQTQKHTSTYKEISLSQTAQNQTKMVL